MEKIIWVYLIKTFVFIEKINIFLIFNTPADFYWVVFLVARFFSGNSCFLKGLSPFKTLGEL